MQALTVLAFTLFRALFFSMCMAMQLKCVTTKGKVTS